MFAIKPVRPLMRLTKSHHPQRDSQMINQSLRNQRVLRHRMFRIGMTKLICTSLTGALLLSVSVVNGQSYTDPLQTNPGGSPGTVTVGDQNYRVVSADQYAKSTGNANPSAVAELPAKPRVAQQLVTTHSTMHDAKSKADCKSCEPAVSSSMRAKLSQACNSCGTPGGAYGCIHCDSFRRDLRMRSSRTEYGTGRRCIHCDRHRRDLRIRSRHIRHDTHLRSSQTQHRRRCSM